jgi:beta-phosphoglucomutase-like phosphatase (HAD superfamily)
MDGVLVNNSRFHREAWRRLAREEGFPLTDPEFWRQAIGRPVEEAVPRILGRPVPPAEAARLARRKTALYHELADGQAPPVAGVVEFVRSLAALGVPRALATSAVADSAARILEGIGLAAVFPVQPAACVVFEDAVVGVEAARRAGMAVVGLTTAHADTELREAGATWTAADFTGLTWAALASP